MSNKWVLFVKEWATKNNMSYGCAMTDPKIKEEYKKSKGVPVREFFNKESKREKVLKTKTKTSPKTKKKIIKDDDDDDDDVKKLKSLIGSNGMYKGMYIS